MCFLKPRLASEQAAWAVYRAALMKTHKIKQRQGFKSSQTPLFLYTYGQNILLQWKVGCFSPQDFQATYWSVIDYVLFTYYTTGIREEVTFPRVTEQATQPCQMFLNIYKRQRTSPPLVFHPCSSPGLYGASFAALTGNSFLVPSTNSGLSALTGSNSHEFFFHQSGSCEVSLENSKAQIQTKKKNRGCKYISRVKDKQFAEAKHLFQIQITRTKSIYSLKTTVASLQATLSTAVMKLNELLFQRQYTKN